MQERNKLRLKVQKSRAEKLKKEQETLQALERRVRKLMGLIIWEP